MLPERTVERSDSVLEGRYTSRERFVKKGLDPVASLQDDEGGWEKGLLTIRHRFAADCQPLRAQRSYTRVKLKNCLFHGQLCAHGNFVPNPLRGFSPLLTFLYKKQGEPKRARLVFRAGKGVRTLDIDLGKVALYQLSYSRESFPNLIKKRTL